MQCIFGFNQINRQIWFSEATKATIIKDGFLVYHYAQIKEGKK